MSACLREEHHRSTDFDWGVYLNGWAERLLVSPVITHGGEAAMRRHVAAFAARGPAGLVLHAEPSMNGERSLFARIIDERLPGLPRMTPAESSSPERREAFLEAVFAYQRMNDCFRGDWTIETLLAFHQRERLLLGTRGDRVYAALSRVIRKGDRLDRGRVEARYRRGLMAALGTPSSNDRRARVLQEAFAAIRVRLLTEERGEMAAAIDDFERGTLPIIVPLTLLRHHASRHRLASLEVQTLLDPHPTEVMLRNHA